MAAVVPRTLPGKGRALVAARDIAAGETVLVDMPVLLAPAADALASACAACVRRLPPTGALPCPGCRSVAFCSSACAAAAATAPCFHTPACAALAALDVAGLDADDASSARLLVTLAVLTAATAAGDSGAGRAMAALGEMAAPPAAAARARAPDLAARAAAALKAAGGTVPPLSTDAAAHWLAVDDANAFGVMEATDPSPSSPSPASLSRRVRGGGLYPAAALLNHDCLPNAARFDHFDAAAAHGGRLEFRALHALPAGEEITTSYVPLDWPRDERSTRFARLYGFVCSCARCRGEAAADAAASADASAAGVTFMRSTRSTDTMVVGRASGASGDGGGGGGGHAALGPAADVGYIAAFLAKHACGCGGTLAPAAAGGGEGDHVCAACGAVRTHADFLAALAGADSGSEWGTEDMSEGGD
jgi:SET and MYND domain-containing protein